MSDENLQELIRDANYEKVVIAARRSKKLSVIKDVKLTLSSTEIFYLYRLRFKGGGDRGDQSRRLYIYAATLEELAKLLIDKVDNSTAADQVSISLPDLGFVKDQRRESGLAPLYEFVYRDGANARHRENHWKLTKVPAIIIGGNTVILGQSPMTPYFKVSGIEVFLEEAGNKTELLANSNREALEARRIASQNQSDKDREKYIKQLRQNRLEVFKESLKIDKKVAENYRDAIKDDPEFSRITAILLGRAGK